MKTMISFQAPVHLMWSVKR